MAQAIPSFDALYFGRASAEKDYTHNPEHFFDSYYDRYSLSERVRSHETFLVLGPKGSGKSAAAKYVEMQWAKELGPSLVFVQHIDFDQVNQTQNPLVTLGPELVSSEVTAATDLAWTLFISVKLVESLQRDVASSLYSDRQLEEVMSKLREVGLASDDYPQVLRRVREKKTTVGVSAKLRSLGASFAQEFKTRDVDQLSPAQIAEALVSLVSQSSTASRHVVAIDGLDKSISAGRSYWEAVVSLIRVSDRLTTKFSNGSENYILVMCRSDMHRNTRFSDSAKILADSSVRIEWGSTSADAERVLLWKYLAKKAGISESELFSFLPRSVPVGGGAVETKKFLLESTRYTPRDMSVLFRILQRVFAESGESKLTGEQVRLACDEFARTHFVNELESEAHGLLDKRVVDAFARIFNALHARKFSKKALRRAIEISGVSDVTTPEDLGEYLFLQGAIANWDPDSRYVQFSHRRDTNQFNTDGPWELHRSLVYGFNLDY